MAHLHLPITVVAKGNERMSSPLSLNFLYHLEIKISSNYIQTKQVSGGGGGGGAGGEKPITTIFELP